MKTDYMFLAELLLDELEIPFDDFFPRLKGKRVELKKMNKENQTRALKYITKICGTTPGRIIHDYMFLSSQWRDKYSFIYLRNRFKYEQGKVRVKDLDEYQANVLLNAIFVNDEPQILESDIYDNESIRERLIEQLRKLDSVAPGMYHKGSEIQNLKIETREIFNYPRTEEMITSLLHMIGQAETYFFKTLKYGLAPEQQREYNFLVSYLGIRDVDYPDGYLYYDELLSVKALYKGIDHDGFKKTIYFDHLKDFDPWTASEFLNNDVLVSEYLKAVPQHKPELRKFLANAFNFICTFTWADDQAQETNSVYVRKEPSEMLGNNDAYDKLMKYCRPEKLGGLSAGPTPRSDEDRRTANNEYFSKIGSKSFSTKCAEDTYLGVNYGKN